MEVQVMEILITKMVEAIKSQCMVVLTAKSGYCGAMPLKVVYGSLRVYARQNECIMAWSDKSVYYDSFRTDVNKQLMGIKQPLVMDIENELVPVEPVVVVAVAKAVTVVKENQLVPVSYCDGMVPVSHDSIEFDIPVGIEESIGKCDTMTPVESQECGIVPKCAYSQWQDVVRAQMEFDLAKIKLESAERAYDASLL